MQAIVQNLMTHYKVHGEGEALVLLHGWGASGESFNLVIPELAKHYKVYALDLPGFGKTQLPPQAWSVGDYARFTEDFLKKMQIKRAAFVGHSFGGRILIKLAARRPELFDKLVLTGAAGIKTKDHLRKSLFKATAKVGKIVLSLPGLNKMREKAKQKLYVAAGTDDYLDAGALRETFVKVTAEDLTPYFEKIEVPTLLIWGKKDLDTPVANGEMMHTRIKNSKLLVFEEAGHYAFVDTPERFWQACLDFLER